MIICYARSSSLKSWEYCQQQYFIEYNLGIHQPPNKKAVMGTITHKVLEWLAKCNMDATNNSLIEFFDDSLQETISIDRQALYSQNILPDNIIDEINKTRSNKSIYKDKCYVAYGAKRTGHEIINDLVIKAFKHYASKNPYDWTTSDLKNCGNWTWIALEWQNGTYDPRNRTIVSPERPFDMVIDTDWANYEYLHKNEKISGKFAIKGTIDLITEVDSDTLEIVDWKTGQRLDWATGEEKTYTKLCSDSQLALYHYAASRLYPQYKNIIITIFFIRDGGPFTISFDASNDTKVENTLREHFEEIRQTRLPKMLSPTQSDFRCKKLCAFYKQNWPNTNQNICQYIHNEVKRIGINQVIDKYKEESHGFTNYNSPGE